MYLTAAEYYSITERPTAEATNARIKLACQLLDARIGNYTRETDGWKLDLDDLLDYKVDAVKTWVAYMIAYLKDNGDKAPSSASLHLSKFSVTEKGQSNMGLPEELAFVDAVLVSSGVINRRVVTS
jgi:hypothetical protein